MILALILLVFFTKRIISLMLLVTLGKSRNNGSWSRLFGFLLHWVTFEMVVSYRKWTWVLDLEIASIFNGRIVSICTHIFGRLWSEPLVRVWISLSILNIVHEFHVLRILSSLIIYLMEEAITTLNWWWSKFLTLR